MRRQSPDYIVSYDPKNDSQTDVAIRIFNSLFIKRQKANKPTIWFIGGDSGSGKSYAGLWALEILKALPSYSALPAQT